MDLKKLWGRRGKVPGALSVQTMPQQDVFLEKWEGSSRLGAGRYELFEAMRATIPIIDAALDKIVRLSGEFSVCCADRTAQREAERFLREVPVGGYTEGLQKFLWGYLGDLLTYGNAVGEIVLDPSGKEIHGLYLAPLKNIELTLDQARLEPVIKVRGQTGQLHEVPYPQLILFSALAPKAGEIVGRSLLEGLPFVTSILHKIYRSMGQNFERIGNLRYAVTYRPGASALDRANAKEIAQNIAKEWRHSVSGLRDGVVRDFVAVGDVDIKVIGADNQMIDTEVPVRQMLEEIVSKLGIPPFMLGLSWSTTERMSKQQADILTTELEYYRSLLEPVIRRVVSLFLRLRALPDEVQVEWSAINLQDEVEQARAELLHAQACTKGGEENEEGV